MAADKFMVPVVFIVCAVVGNLAVVIVVAAYRKMRCTPNILLASLASVDLLYVLTYLPFVTYANLARDWPFGNAWCMISQFALHTTLFMRAYVLVLMAFERFLAAMRPSRPMTRRAAVIAVVTGMVVICLANSPTFGHYGTIRLAGQPNTTLCVNHRRFSGSRYYGCMLYGSMFALGYAMPLLVIVVLCGVKFVCWLTPASNCPVTVSSSSSSQTAAETNEINGRHATRVVVVVVVVFAVLQLPIQVVHLLTECALGHVPFPHLTLTIVQLLMPVNSCINPVLYAVLSLLSGHPCRSSTQPDSDDLAMEFTAVELTAKNRPGEGAEVFQQGTA